MKPLPLSDAVFVRCEACECGVGLGYDHARHAHSEAVRIATRRGPRGLVVSGWAFDAVFVQVPAQMDGWHYASATIEDSGRVSEMWGREGRRCLKVARRVVRIRNRLLKSRTFMLECAARVAAGMGHSATCVAPRVVLGNYETGEVEPLAMVDPPPAAE